MSTSPPDLRPPDADASVLGAVATADPSGNGTDPGGRPRSHRLLAAAAFAAPVAAAAILGSRFGPGDAGTARWYRSIVRRNPEG
jgi:hypothetical protein